MFWELLQKFRCPEDSLGCPRLLGSCYAAALGMRELGNGLLFFNKSTSRSKNLTIKLSSQTL